MPDSRHSWFDESMNLEECKKTCLADCNCTAYSNLDIRNDGSGCLLWFGELIDIREYSKNEQDLYVRVAASELGSEVGNEDHELPLFDLVTVTTATKNFSSANVIGEGGFALVYKDILPDGQELAVKRLSKNLVQLVGCCLEGEERMLIYEFMHNASLDYFIFDPNRKASLAWKNHFEIAKGISRGLLYLHQDSRFRIIHRDLKTSYIILDADMNAKISDFGLAKYFGGEQVEGNTKRVIGTYAYMSPEYAVDGKYSVKSAVFSIGVVILELVSGRRNRKFRHLEYHHNVLGHAWLLCTEGNALELMDECLEESFSESQVLSCIQLGCCASKSSQRIGPQWHQ